MLVRFQFPGLSFKKNLLQEVARDEFTHEDTTLVRAGDQSACALRTRPSFFLYVLLYDEHRVSKGVEAIVFLNSFVIGAQDKVASGECRYEHDECGFR